jgi:hypothetical protein
MPNVSITEYAELRGINKSTVSRQVRKLQVPTERVNGQLMVDVDELDRARERYLNPLMRRVPEQETGSPAAEPEMTAPGPAELPGLGSADAGGPVVDERRSSGAAAAGVATLRPASGLVAQQELEKKLKNRRLLREIEHEEGRLVPASIVLEEQQTQARKLRDRLMQGAADLAGELYALTTRPRTEGELRVWLQRQMRDLLERVAAEIAAERDDDGEEAPADEEDNDAVDGDDQAGDTVAGDDPEAAAEAGVGAPDGPEGLVGRPEA